MRRTRALRLRSLLQWIVPILFCIRISFAQVQPSLQASSGRDCATCHVGWTDSFRRPGAILLIDKPPESFVSDPDNCLGCHDGSVGDSRRRVWVEHGHKTGVAPPDTMKVPSELPLTDGKLACRTCHTAHARRASGSMAEVFFLRMPNDAGQLCVTCHASYVKGPDQGSHPLGNMKIALPESLKNANARAGADDHTLNCRSCHTPHGEKEEHLLVLKAEDRTLCLSCHQELTPDRWQSGRHHPHPQEAKLNSDEQRQAIKDLHTRLGPEQTLICLSCHKIHTAVPKMHLLADTLENSALCLRCHVEQKTVIDSDHDLRKNAPSTVNLQQQTATTGGPCSACHGIHEPSRELSPGVADPTGQCLSCHRQGQCAEKKTAQPVSHPSKIDVTKLPKDLPLKLLSERADGSQSTIACLTCHNPHKTSNGHFLREPHDVLCATCHVEQGGMASGLHDFTTRAELKNSRGESAIEAGKCGFCHGIHNAIGARLWVATADAPKTPEALCVSCHRPGGLAAEKPGSTLRHPYGDATLAALRDMKTTLPLFNRAAEHSQDGFMSCGTCHDPHGHKEQPKLLRIADGDSQQQLCMSCHENAAPLEHSLHASTLLTQAGFTAGVPTACGPCHSTHEVAEMGASGMRAGPFGPPQDPPGVRECTGCHRVGGGAPVIHRTIHPSVLIQNVSPMGTPSFMPLLNDQGMLGEAGLIVCVTCHLPHGRSDLPGLLDAKGTGIDELRSLRPMVRPYLPPNVCSSCHGAEGLQRFLYYHWPEKRPSSMPAGQ